MSVIELINADGDLKTQFLRRAFRFASNRLRHDATNTSGRPSQMYGLIGKMRAVEGQRDALSAILLEGLKDMPNCHSYIVANDPVDGDLLWITEVWSDSAAHTASLSLPSVQSAIQKGRPLIAGMERVAETAPLGGTGL
jgi:quinol monooxygenase YgiN